MKETLYIAKSKIRQDLLALFFTNPSKKYYLRELERILGHSAGSIRRELLKYQTDDLFKTEKVGNLLYYSLNTNHPLYKELKSIVFKTVGVEGSLKKELSSMEKIKICLIYGSFASEQYKATSDIDLMIIGNPATSELNERIARLEKRLKREINTTVYSWQEFQDKKKLKSAFIKDLLKNPKIILLGKEDDL
ncbi:MAG: nucleotidyltransferase domain-containing protein [Candidatus Aminicenantes bacterium]|nr:MAG: nucleotidyltransferase domain-containing protein [Candidatus Aminicenantes bacterium]